MRVIVKVAVLFVLAWIMTIYRRSQRKDSRGGSDDVATMSSASALQPTVTVQPMADMTVPIPPHSGPERQIAQATASQSRATWLTAVATVIALTVSTVGLVSQVNINTQQAKLNEIAERRLKRIYSSRVAIWSVASTDNRSNRPEGLDLTVENRSPVPLLSVLVSAPVQQREGESTQHAGALSDVPPCKAALIRVAVGDRENTAFKRPALGQDVANTLTLTFRIGDDTWRLDSTGLAGPFSIKEGLAASVLPRQLRIAPGPITPVNDCGEGA